MKNKILGDTCYVFKISKFVILTHNKDFIMIFSHSVNCTRILLSYGPKNIFVDFPSACSFNILPLQEYLSIFPFRVFFNEWYISRFQQNIQFMFRRRRIQYALPWKICILIVFSELQFWLYAATVQTLKSLLLGASMFVPFSIPYIKKSSFLVDNQI